MLREKIKEMLDMGLISKKELFEVGEITRQALNSYLRGGDIRVSVLEKWAKKWPRLICEGFELPCKKDRKLAFDEINNEWDEKRVNEYFEEKFKREDIEIERVYEIALKHIIYKAGVGLKICLEDLDVVFNAKK